MGVVQQWVWAWCWAVLGVLVPTAVFAAPIDVLRSGHPNAIHADNKDRFYLDYGADVVRYGTSVERTFRYSAPKDMSISSIEHHVSPPTGTIVSLMHASERKCLDKECTKVVINHRWIQFVCKEDGACKEDTLARWQTRSGSGSNNESWKAMVRVTDQGTRQLRLTHTVVRDGKGKTTVEYRCGDQNCDANGFQEQWYSELQVTPLARIDPETHVILAPNARRSGGVLEALAGVDVSAVYDAKGGPHVFRQASAGRSFEHEHLSGSAVDHTTVDTRESGAFSSALRLPEGILTFHAFYRNSYYKGVKASFFPNGQAEHTWQVDVDSGRDTNPGWDLVAAATPQGRVMAAWLSDPKQRSTNLQLYQNLQDVRGAALPEPEGWEKDAKMGALLAGAGVGWMQWELGSSTPSASTLEGATAARVDAAYRVRDAIMAEASLEARWGRFMFGGSYARQAIEGLERDLGLSSAMADRLNVALGVDRLIRYHDLRVQIRRARLVGQYDMDIGGAVERGGVAPSGNLDSRYQRTDVLLLNTKRVRYGILRQSEDLVLPFYAFADVPGDVDEHFRGSFVRAATVRDTAVTVGYSRLDYAAKYENNINKPFFDFDLGIGVSTALLDGSISVPAADGIPGESFSQTSTVFFPYNVELGFLMQRRSYKLHGVGGYVRTGYRGEGNLTGIVSRSTDREEAPEEHDMSLRYSRNELRHGPFFQMGVVF